MFSSKDWTKRRLHLFLSLNTEDGVTKVEEGNTNAGDGEESVVRVDDELRTGVLKEKKSISIVNKPTNQRDNNNTYSQPQRKVSVVLVKLLVFDNTVGSLRKNHNLN
jgi:hypothetical protein